MGTVYHGVHPMQVWSTVKCRPLQTWGDDACSMQSRWIASLSFSEGFCWGRCCAWWSVESACRSPLSFLMPRPAWGKSPFHREAVCKFAVCKEYSESVSSPPKRESCLEKCKSLNCGRACMWGLLVELNINKLSRYQ